MFRKRKGGSMRLTIKSRRFGADVDFVASLPNSRNSAYVKVFLCHAHHQICDGGFLCGSTISASAESFEYVCRQWWKQYLRNTREEV